MTLPLATALHNAGVITVHGCLLACPGGPHLPACEDLRTAVEATVGLERDRDYWKRTSEQWRLDARAKCALCHLNTPAQMTVCEECINRYG